MDAEYMVVIFRGVERNLIIIGAMLSIICGTFMLIRGVTGGSDAEWRSIAFTLKLFRISPGVFFGLFGAATLIISMQSQASLKKIRTVYSESENGFSDKNGLLVIEQSEYGLAAGQEFSQKQVFQARNTLIHLVKTDLLPESRLMELERIRIKKAIQIMDSYHYAELKRVLKRELDWYYKVKENDRSSLEKAEQIRYKNIEEYVKGMLD